MAEDNQLKLVIKRTFDAPREKVFQAWTDQKQMAEWSCPKGFVTTFGEADVKPEGAYRSGMRAPDGNEYIVVGKYKEINEPERLVMTHAWEINGKPGQETLITVSFTEKDGKTEMTFIQEGFESEQSRDSHEDGWNQCFDKLSETLK